MCHCPKNPLFPILTNAAARAQTLTKSLSEAMEVTDSCNHLTAKIGLYQSANGTLLLFIPAVKAKAAGCGDSANAYLLQSHDIVVVLVVLVVVIIV